MTLPGHQVPDPHLQKAKRKSAFSISRTPASSQEFNETKRSLSTGSGDCLGVSCTQVVGCLPCPGWLPHPDKTTGNFKVVTMSILCETGRAGHRPR